jgi:ElaB/YqjD/DUF883 family membrane-anchored ribosome-binding protein
VSGEAELRIECDRLLDSLEIVTTERDAALRQVALWQKTEGIARDSLEAARAQIAAALAEHEQRMDGRQRVCSTCLETHYAGDYMEDWPCPTVRALTGEEP